MFVIQTSALTKRSLTYVCDNDRLLNVNKSYNNGHTFMNALKSPTVDLHWNQSYINHECMKRSLPLLGFIGTSLEYQPRMNVVKFSTRTIPPYCSSSLCDCYEYRYHLS